MSPRRGSAEPAGRPRALGERSNEYLYRVGRRPVATPSREKAKDIAVTGLTPLGSIFQVKAFGGSTGDHPVSAGSGRAPVALPAGHFSNCLMEEHRRHRRARSSWCSCLPEHGIGPDPPVKSGRLLREQFHTRSGGAVDVRVEHQLILSFCLWVCDV